jgi:hypothetical protein
MARAMLVSVEVERFKSYPGMLVRSRSLVSSGHAAIARRTASSTIRVDAIGRDAALLGKALEVAEPERSRRASAGARRNGIDTPRGWPLACSIWSGVGVRSGGSRVSRSLQRAR